MAIVTGTALESNKNFRVNFDGGNLSSDGGLLLLKEFYHKLGVKTLLKKHFHTTDSASFRIHKDHENLLQMLYQITGAYFQDDHADSLRNDPVLNAVVGKAALASQPTLSRFHNRMDAQSLEQLEERFNGFSAEEFTPSKSQSIFCSIWIPLCWLPMARRRVRRSTTTTRHTDTIPCFASTA